MRGPAPLSPASRKIPDIELRIERLREFEEQFPATRIDIATLIGEDAWRKHLGNLDLVIAAMRESQKLADEIRLTLAAQHQRISAKPQSTVS